jgi:hypothetical protein
MLDILMKKFKHISKLKVYNMALNQNKIQEMDKITGLSNDKISEMDKILGYGQPKQQTSMFQQAADFVSKTFTPAARQFGQAVTGSMALGEQNKANQNLIQQLQTRAQQQQQAGDTQGLNETMKMLAGVGQDTSQYAQQLQQDINYQPDESNLGYAARSGLSTGLEVGSFIAPGGSQAATAMGRVAQTAGRGAISGTMLGASKAFREKEISDIDNLIKETSKGATIGAVTGAVLQGGVETLKGIGKAGKKLATKILNASDDASDALYASQYNVPRSIAQQNRMKDTIASLSDDGFGKIDDVDMAIKKVTGRDGIITKYTREAVGSADDVNLDGMMDLVSSIADDPSLPVGTDDKFIKAMKKAIVSLRKGKLDKADPMGVYDYIQSLEGKVAKLKYTGPYTGVPSPENQALAEAYQLVVDELKDRLFSQSNADDVLVSKLKDKIINELGVVSPKLAEKAKNITDVRSLRSIAAPYVRASKLIKSTEAGKQVFQQTFADQARGLGKFISRPLNLLAIPAEAATVPLAGAIKKTTGGLGNISTGALQKASNIATSNPMLSAIERAIMRQNEKAQEKKTLR